MSDTVLVAETGRATGSAASRRLRAEDWIPGVVYGLGMEPLVVSVKRRDLRTALSGTAALNTVLDLQVDGTTYSAIVKDLQRHPVRRHVSHVDFIQVNLNAEITVSVPLRLEGTALEVLNNDGLVDPAVDSIEVVCTPRNIPDEFVIDISEMKMDTVIRLVRHRDARGRHADRRSRDGRRDRARDARQRARDRRRRRRGGVEGEGVEGEGRGRRGRRRRAAAEAAGESGGDAGS